MSIKNKSERLPSNGGVILEIYNTKKSNHPNNRVLQKNPEHYPSAGVETRTFSASGEPLDG